MERKDILTEPSYWLSVVQTELYRLAEGFMEEHGMNRKELAAHLGVTPGYVTQLLNGDFDHRLSSVAELSLALGYVPTIGFIPIGDVLSADCSGCMEMGIRQDTGLCSNIPCKGSFITNAA